MVRGRGNVDNTIIDMLKKIEARLDVVETAQRRRVHLEDVSDDEAATPKHNPEPEEDQVKDEMRKEFHSCLWSWSLPIPKRVVWPVKRLVREKRWHSKVEVGFVDQFVESDTEPTEQPKVVKDIPNLVDAKMDIGFHDQLVESDMETTEHLVVNDLVAVGGELCIAEHGLACIDGDLHVGADVEFFVVDVGFVATGADSLVADLNEVLLMKHYVQFVLGVSMLIGWLRF